MNELPKNKQFVTLDNATSSQAEASSLLYTMSYIKPKVSKIL